MKHLNTVIGMALLMSFSGTSAVAAPLQYDAVADFSIDNGNSNGVWTHGWMDANFSNFTAYTLTGDGTFPIWLYGKSGPAIWISDATDAGVIQGQMILHPGPYRILRSKKDINVA